MAYVTAFWPTDFSTQECVRYYVADAAADLPSNDEGDMAYQKDVDKLAFYDGTTWRYLASSSGSLFD